MQIQLEVCNVDECIYYEFRPPSARIKEVRVNEMRVRRDCEWFQRALPLMQAYVEHMVRLKRLAQLYQTPWLCRDQKRHRGSATNATE